MLREIDVSRATGEPRRRWFADEDFDLIVWFDDLDVVTAFELCYDRLTAERALTWSAATGYRHFRVDTGEPSALRNLTPILLPEGDFARDRVIAEFAGAASAIEPAISSLVVERLRAFAS